MVVFILCAQNIIPNAENYKVGEICKKLGPNIRLIFETEVESYKESHESSFSNEVRLLNFLSHVTKWDTLRRKRRSIREKNSLIILMKYFLLLAVCTHGDHFCFWLLRLLCGNGTLLSRVHKNKTY